MTVRVAGSVLGTINEDGQYQAAKPGTSQDAFDFTVVRVQGQWRILNPTPELLLSKTEVSRTFRSRDLYFFDPTLSALVPDPVYVPAEATSQQLVAHLVAALQQGPQGWLARGTKTAFPHGTSPARHVGDRQHRDRQPRRTRRRDDGQQREQMAEQLLETLASAPAYPQPDTASVQSVVFEINGKPVHLSCTTGQPPSSALQNKQLVRRPGPCRPGSRALRCRQQRPRGDAVGLGA